MSVQWIPFPDARTPVFGLPFFTETTPDLLRLPKRAEGVVRDPVWGLAQQTSGGRIRFATDSSQLAIRVNYPNYGHMQNMCMFGKAGVDGCIDGQFWSIASPREEGPLEHTFYANMPRGLRQVCLYLPLYQAIAVEAIGIDDDARIEPPAPFAAEKPVVYYGSSITQGGCSSRPGLSYQAILSRTLNLDFVNLGFSGNGKGEPEVAKFMAEIDASCFVLDFAQNVATAAELGEVYLPFIETVRAAHPATPMICVTPIWADSEFISQGAVEKLEGQRDVVRAAVAQRLAAGDRHIRCVEGPEILGPDLSYGFVDGVHPNDLGFMSMAEGLTPVLKETLGI